MEKHGDKKNETFSMTGDWTVQSKKLQEKFPSLTDDDLHFQQGKENELLTRIEKRLSKKREDIISIIKKNQLK